MAEVTLKNKLEVMRSEMENERSSFLSHWREIALLILPRRPQFTVTDTNRGDRRNQAIIDPTATLAARTLRSGMMSGVTSPARPWFRLTTPDPDLAEFGSVKDWLHTTSNRMSTVFLRSNLYNILPTTYGDMGTFATAAIGVEEDFDNVIRFNSFPIGSYMIANNDKLRVDTFFREFRLTVSQLIRKFGGDNPRNINWSKFSPRIKNYYDRGQLQVWIEVCHVIYPNDQYDGNGLMSNQKKYRSIYYEKGGKDYQDEKFLSDNGYDYFPVLCPRWETTGEDVYGTECPGMMVLGDVKQLQHGEKKGLQALDKMINPPLKAPMSLRSQKVSLLPGDVTHVDEREGDKALRPVHEVNPNFEQLEFKQQQVRDRIRRAYYEDLFLMLAQTDRRQITAREIDERHEEKLLALGPVLEQLNQDLLDPLIDLAFNIMMQQGYVPEPPEELQGVTLKVEYISILAQAQKMVGLAGIERFAGFAGSVAQFKPDCLDKIDADQMLDEYGEITGIPPRIIVPDEQVAKIREGRAAAMKQQQQLEQLAGGAKTAKDLAGAQLEQPSALSALLEQAQAGQVTQ